MTARVLQHGHTELVFSIEGEVGLDERGDAPDYYPKSLVLLDNGTVEVEFSMSHDDDYSEHLGLRLNMRSYHNTNPETGRCFHCKLGVSWQRSELRMLRDYLTLLLEHST